MILDGLYLVGAVLVTPVILWRMLRTGKYRRGWRQRLGGVPRRTSTGEAIWIHAVSVGEVNAAMGLIEQLNCRMPACEIWISTTTDTGYDRACRVFGPDRVFRYPLDFSWSVRAALDRIRPALVILVELEVWYNFVAVCHRRKIPVMVVNGRLSERSFRRYRLLGRWLRPMFSRLTAAAVQDEAYAERFRRLGVAPERVRVVGTMKYDTAQVGGEVAGADELARQLGLTKDEALWVAGSTGPGEEEIILNAWRSLTERFPALRLAIVPRKPERFEAVARLIREKGHDLIRRSKTKTTPADGPSNAVILGDTMGELRKFYSLARIVFVGRTLVPMGGSDMMEPVGLGCVTLVGPHTDNFASTMADLLAEDAIVQIACEKDLTTTVQHWLDNDDASRAMAQRAIAAIRTHKGVTARTAEWIEEIV